MTLPRAARYPAAYIQALIDVASNHGIHQETLLEHAGLDVADLRRPDVSIEQPRLMMLYQAAILLSGNDSIGLEVGKQVHPGLFSTLGYALKSCATLAEAIAVSPAIPTCCDGAGKSVARRQRRLRHAALAACFAHTCITEAA